MYPTVNLDAKKGSAPKYSKFRLLSGERWIFTPGPSRKLAPFERASRPISVPTRSASGRFQVAANAIPPAIAVAGPKLRTPTGPSAIFKRGQLSRGMSRIKNPSTPPSRSIFSSSVIWLRMDSTRRSTSPEDRREGNAGDCPKVEDTREVIKHKTTSEQSLRMDFPLAFNLQSAESDSRLKCGKRR